MTSTGETTGVELTTEVAGSGAKDMVFPIEIIEQIALHLADDGSRSAVTAALIHPAITKNCLERMFTNGITAHISKPSTLDALVRQLSARSVPIQIKGLRFKPSTFCSLKQEDNVKQVLNHLLEVEYDIDDLQLFLPNYRPIFDAEYSNKAFLHSVRNLTIVHGPYPLQHVGVAFFIEEVTLVEPGWFAIWALRLLPNLHTVFLFFIEDDEEEEDNWWSPVLHRYALCCRRGVLEKLHLIKALQATNVYFVVMDGDPQVTCTIQRIGRLIHGVKEHHFYRFCYTSDLNEFQRLDTAKELIRLWESVPANNV